MKIGILRETKTPPDERVPLSPKHCLQLQKLYPELDIAVQPSPIRKFADHEYSDLGIKLQEDLNDRDILLGVKEVKIEALIPNKTYLFFSHTFKLQPYNAKLLRAILERKIRLVDYELIKADGHRLIGFGRYAGIVGCYNGFRAFGLKHSLYNLKPAHSCHDRKEMEAELHKVSLPTNAKVVLTGCGRVGHGAREILDLLPIKEVSSSDFLTGTFDQPVFTQLDVEDYNQRSSDGLFDKAEFYKSGKGYESTFMQYAKKADMYVACHYWAGGSPFIFTKADVKDPDWRISVVADISCDVAGPVASTLRASTIASPFYGYHRQTGEETEVTNTESIAVMAVDNLPCELPRDASVDFGNELIDKVLPHLFGDDNEGIIAGASETSLEGILTAPFAYLDEYARNA
jgi:saccharopine dehydrogenase (NAD+, L-lysine forming)